jgi:predicted DNA-binding transcriptional regulator AlpA
LSDRLLSYPQLKSEKGIEYTRQHLARMERDGLFPRRVQVGPNRVAWWESEIDERNRSLPRGPLPDAAVAARQALRTRKPEANAG